MEALRALKKLDESVKDFEIRKYPADEYCVKVGVNPGEFDWDETHKTKFVYAYADGNEGLVGLELEDGRFAVVGSKEDHICADYDDMIADIKYSIDDDDDVKLSK